MGGLKKVDEEAKKADELFQDFVQKGMKTDPAHVTPDDKAGTTPVEEKPKADTGVNTELQQKHEALEHKYNVLRGKYEAEVPRAAAENKLLREKVSNLEQSVTELQKKTEVSHDDSKKADNDQIFKTLEDELGTSVVNALKQIVSGNNSHTDDFSKITRRLDEYESKLNRVETTQVKTTGQTFEERLTTLVPDWEKVNHDPKWLAWLENRVPMTRMTYQQSLDDAANSFDVKGVAEIFNAFKAGNKQPEVKPKPDIEEYIEPGAVKPSSNPAQGDKKTYTRKEVDKFYHDCKLGKYTLEEQRSLEKEFDLAISENRIIG